MEEKERAVFKYISLRTRGIGAGLTSREIDILNVIPEDEWKSIKLLINLLGGE